MKNINLEELKAKDNGEVIKIISELIKKNENAEEQTLLQNKLIDLGYEKKEYITIPESMKMDELKENIINYFCSIDFLSKTDESINKIVNLKGVLDFYDL